MTALAASALLCLAAALAPSPQVGAAAAVPTPEAFLGRPPASDFTLTDWDELAGYYRALAAASPNVRLETVGRTTDGRDFLLAVIGSEENLARLDELCGLARRVADPRGLDEEGVERLLEEAVPFLFVSLGMHSTECAAWDFGMEFAHRLATSDAEPYASARERLVVWMPPCLNPDGVDRVAGWYREHVGTPYEGTDLLELYQEYAGHDNNRDWFALSLQETRVVTGLLYGRVFPQVYWDVHQQGGNAERFFVPGYRDPLNPNVDPRVVLGAELLGARALLDMTAEGLTGIATGVTYDMWWNGGNRSVPARHNVLGLLTEAASCELGSPRWVPRSALRAPGDLDAYQPSNRFPVPWPGGWWRLRDVVEYEHAFARSLLASLVREPRLVLETTLRAAQSSVEAGRSGSPRAYLIPPDDRAGAQRTRLLDNLGLLGVEVHRATSEVRADGRTWPAGSIVVRLDQPYGRFVRDLFEAQEYPAGQRPYDVAGWTFPALLGVETVEVHAQFEAELVPAGNPAGAQTAFVAPLEAEGLLDLRDGTSFVRAVGALAEGRPVALVTESEAGPPGFVVGAAARSAAARYGEERVELLPGLPRIGVYSPWSGVMNEGWLRNLLDRYAVPYVRARPETLRAGRLSELFDVIVLPSLSERALRTGRPEGSVPERWSGGLDDEGFAALEAFVRGGGRVVAMESSAMALVDALDLPLADATRDEEAREFSCPGSVLRTRAVLPGWDAPAVMFAGGAAFRVTEGPSEARARIAVEYAPRETLLSGWMRRPETVAGAGFVALVDLDEGDLVLFGCRPQYRGWSEHAFLTLLRALIVR